MDKNKLILPITILLASIILGGFYYASEINKQKSIEKQQVKTDQEKALEQEKEQADVAINEATKLAKDIENNEEEQNKKRKEDIARQEENKRIQSEADQARKDNESILLNYRLDAKDISGISETLLEAVYNNAETVCPSIISSRTTRDNIYYIYLDEFAGLEMKYGKYRDKIQYINNNLYSWNNIIQIVKDKCASFRYDI